MKEYDIIKAAVSADMPDIEAVRRRIVTGEKNRRIPVVRWASGVAAALVLAAGIFIAAQKMQNADAFGDEPAGVNEQTQSGEADVDIHINEGSRGSSMADVAAFWKVADVSELPDEFSCLREEAVPEGFYLGRLGAYYVRENPVGKYSPDEPLVLYDYEAMYVPIGEKAGYASEDGGERYASVAMSYMGKPIQGCCGIVEEYDEISRIGDTEVLIYGHNVFYNVSFQYGGAYFDIETMGMTETELVDLLCSIIK